MGFVLIRTEAMRAAGPRPFLAPELDPSASEDISFFWRMYEAGWSTAILPSVTPGHIKTHTIVAPSA
jgi:hypothetical protein